MGYKDENQTVLVFTVGYKDENQTFLVFTSRVLMTALDMTRGSGRYFFPNLTGRVGSPSPAPPRPARFDLTREQTALGLYCGESRDDCVRYWRSVKEGKSAANRHIRFFCVGVGSGETVT